MFHLYKYCHFLCILTPGAAVHYLYVDFTMLSLIHVFSLKSLKCFNFLAPESWSRLILHYYISVHLFLCCICIGLDCAGLLNVFMCRQFICPNFLFRQYSRFSFICCRYIWVAPEPTIRCTVHIWRHRRTFKWIRVFSVICRRHWTLL